MWFTEKGSYWTNSCSIIHVVSQYIHRLAMYLLYGYDVTSGMYIIVRNPIHERYETEAHSWYLLTELYTPKIGPEPVYYNNFENKTSKF